MREPEAPAAGWVGALVAFLLFPGVLWAQGADRATVRLDRVQAALDSGRVAEARTALETWLDSDREAAPGPQRERARFLRARLATDADEAESIYRRLALEAGSRYAPMARLRLAQLRLAGGRASGALRDLELLRADYPGHPLVAESWFWTGLARKASDGGEGACEAFRRAVDGASRSGRDDLAARAREELAACGEDGTGPAWAVQVGAFSSAERATRRLDRLDRAGHDGRLVTGEDGLVRVRVGRFAREADAEELADRLRASGLDAVVVSEDASGSGP